ARPEGCWAAAPPPTSTVHAIPTVPITINRFMAASLRYDSGSHRPARVSMAPFDRSKQGAIGKSLEEWGAPPLVRCRSSALADSWQPARAAPREWETDPLGREADRRETAPERGHSAHSLTPMGGRAGRGSRGPRYSGPRRRRYGAR